MRYPIFGAITDNLLWIAGCKVGRQATLITIIIIVINVITHLHPGLPTRRNSFGVRNGNNLLLQQLAYMRGYVISLRLSIASSQTSLATTVVRIRAACKSAYPLAYSHHGIYTQDRYNPHQRDRGISGSKSFFLAFLISLAQEQIPLVFVVFHCLFQGIIVAILP